MNNLSRQSQQALHRLVGKANNQGRMPSLRSIHSLLVESGLDASLRSSRNIVEYRSRGRSYVNSRHEGKSGYRLNVGNLELDSSESYYSANSWNYARRLLDLLNVQY
jgi:hypothetical protein